MPEQFDDAAFGDGETPLLLRKRVVVGIVLGFAGLVAAYFIAARIFGFSPTFDAEPFQDWVQDFGPWGPVVFIIVMALSVLFAPVPNAPIFIAAGLAWGPVVGTAYSMAGLTLGSTMAFYAARFLGRRHLRRLIGAKTAERLDHMADTMGGRVVFFSRMMPGINFDWISFLAGMTSVRFGIFIFYSFLGMLFPTGLAVAAGDSLGRDTRITVLLGGIWVFTIVLTALYFWWRRRQHLAARRKLAQTGAERSPELG